MISDQVLGILAADNLDVACSAIEKAAMERAVSDVDEGFAASYEARLRHREVGFILFYCFGCLCKVRFSSATANPSGTHPPLTLTTPSTSPTHYRSKPTVYSLIRLAYTRTSVSMVSWIVHCNSHSISGMVSRRRIASRPSSTVSYNRNDMITPGIYAPSPAPDPAENQAAFNHEDAMDRFTVRNSLKL